jgi:hypothetical protein
MLPGASQPFFSPARGRSLVSAFPSPVTTYACAYPIPGSKVPTCYFAPCYLLPLPVRPFRSATNAGSPRLRPPQRFWPVATSANNPPTAPPASTPLRDFYLPRDQSVQQNSPPAKPAFRIRPISSRSPQPVSIARSLGYGSPFLVRYVSGGLLFLKPLGTSLNMPSPGLFVNPFLTRRRPFSSSYLRHVSKQLQKRGVDCL